MSPEIQTIHLRLPFRMGNVNAFLAHTSNGYILIDTGGSNRRAELERLLTSAGCTPGHLDLVVLTHGDFDHAGNAAYLRETFGAQVAMHAGDVGMVERGDMFWNRTQGSALDSSLSGRRTAHFRCRRAPTAGAGTGRGGGAAQTCIGAGLSKWATRDEKAASR